MYAQERRSTGVKVGMSHLMTDTYKMLLFYLLANVPEFYFIVLF